MSCKPSQYETIGRLISRRKGATVAELVSATLTSSPHKRMQEMRRKGWKIVRQAIEGKTYGRYFGVAPEA